MEKTIKNPFFERTQKLSKTAQRLLEADLMTALEERIKVFERISLSN